MSDSALATVKILSPHKNKRTKKIVGVAIHCMAGNLSVETCGKVFQSREASSNYGIGSDGRIGLYVHESDRSWCTSSAEVDHRAVTIEVANTKNGDPWPISDKAYSSLISLLVDICVRNKIDSLRWKANKSYGTSFNTKKQNIWVHRWFANKSCPGDYIYKKLGKIADEVNALLNSLTEKQKDKIISDANKGKSYSLPVSESASKSKTSSSSYTAATTGTTNSNTVTASAERKYLAAVSRNTSANDFSQYTKHDVVGLLIEAGYLFDTKHNKVSNFQSPKLDAQISYAAAGALVYGFYFIARGRTLEEIKEEIYQLSFVIRKYPPRLGLWLVLDLTTSVTTNDRLLDIYYERLLPLGLKGQLGLYVTPNQLKTITWKNHQDAWWLCLVNRYTSADNFKGDITADMFKSEV